MKKKTDVPEIERVDGKPFTPEEAQGAFASMLRALAAKHAPESREHRREDN